MQITAERGKDFARSRGVGKCSRRKEGGAEGFPGGVTFSPPHTPRIPAEGETMGKLSQQLHVGIRLMK